MAQARDLQGQVSIRAFGSKEKPEFDDGRYG